MLNLRQQTVNVKRTDLIAALKQGLDLHKAQYTEALNDYHTAVITFLRSAVERVELDGDYSDVVLKLSSPENKEKEYLDVIEMLEVSVDETIQLDKESYKAFYKNEWPWTQNFLALAASYKAFN